MGQYYTAVNLDKKQYIKPHACLDGAKLLEFALNSMGLMSCMAILLADGNGRGGGDLYGGECPECNGRGSFGSFADNNHRICEACGGSGKLPAPEIVGSWAGDRVVITGDYADDRKFVPEGTELEIDGEPQTEFNLYTLIYESDEWTDVSLDAMRALAVDPYIRQQLQKQVEEMPYYADRINAILSDE